MSCLRAPKFSAGELNVYSNPGDVREVSRALRHTGRRVMLVPTMGALHDGHLALGSRCQTGARLGGGGVDLRQPVAVRRRRGSRRLPAGRRRDLALLRGEGVEIAFTPSDRRCTRTARVPPCIPVRWDPSSRAAARPTHFAGMLTVVLKLLQIVAPDRVFFGEKDYQQLVLVRQMVADLNVDVRVVGVPIVRENDGLAMSSRNRYLSAAQRELAGILSAALLAGTHAAAAGADAALQAAGGGVVGRYPRSTSDYLEVRDSLWGRPRPPVPDVCWSPRGSARPDCSTTSRSTSEPSSTPTGECPSVKLPNHAGGIDVTNNAQVQDPPGDRRRRRTCTMSAR